MTELDTRISLELEFDLLTSFSESMPCEVPVHGNQPHLHEGEGEWYIISDDCEHCGLDGDTILVCKKFKEIVEASISTGDVPCGVCKKRRRLSDMGIRFERKGEG